MVKQKGGLIVEVGDGDALYGSWSLAEEYGFTDVNGERPDWWSYFSDNFPHMVNAAPNTGFRWRLERVGGK